MKMPYSIHSLNITKTILASALCGVLLLTAPVQAVQPYAADANTVLLEHFDGSVSGNLFSYYSGTGCGSRYPQTGPYSSYIAGPNGLNNALQLSHPTGIPEPTATALTYPGDLLSQANGTLEFWIYITNFSAGISLAEQGQYYTACAGWTFGMGLNTNGVLSASAWAAFDMNSAANTVPLNKWTHLAATWGSTGAKLYINGRLVGTSSNTGRPAPGFGGSLMMRLGTHDAKVCAAIDELRVSNIQRTSFNVPTSATLSEMKAYAGFRITGPVGTPCVIEYAPTIGNTNQWFALTNLNLPSNPYLFIDCDSPNKNRFYRATLNP